MTDKEKDAVEYLSGLDKTKIFYNNPPSYNNLSMGGAIEIVLNLIQTQQEEINDLKWRNEIYVKSIKSHKSEIEKKDKIIDEMAEQIYDEWYIPNIKTVDDVKEHFINKVEKESKDDN